MDLLSLIAPNSYAEACFKSKSLDELLEPFDPVKNAEDLAAWGITKDEWREQLKIAIAAKLEQEEQEKK